jgi:hypothetical protein
MIKKLLVRPLFLCSMVVLGIIIVTAFAVVLPTHAAPAVPPEQSNISQAPGGPAHFGPKMLTCTRQPGKSCISIANTTVAPQTVYLKGKAVFTLAPAQTKGISYTKAGTYVYTLKDAAKLTVTVH